MGGKGTSKGGKSVTRGSSTTSSKGPREVYKPWVKQEIVRTHVSRREGGDDWSSRSGTSRRGGDDDWSRRKDTDRWRSSRDNKGSGGGLRDRGVGSSGKGRTKGKGKGKGKGKHFKAAPLNSRFWERKEETENREIVGTEQYTGKIERYNLRQGWGFIQPDDPNELPKEVLTKLEEACAEAEANGKEVRDVNQLYFRKPDVNHTDGFKLTKDVPVIFSVYIDAKGAGACDVTQPEG
mmetsp:Transcript_70517/g.139937  ORF Transcript_70517/g.139937 Transcript_70517/m.139937 type:complete len:236 (+) Transcript_70517:87-794(+)|eukprot:CAMPEP_0172713982 /NCGR_PEP_ID=MMETSP1074-20121228/64309_1 /TAXON_ID=2916 /ORGANISM="Ceratium fusus, Strain PA161109" /LENGTH=235 /DNA_ID=CAMNT_0013538249 /DNA_START=66 /DNA_END=773 /DNA_ORIENTATION=+